MKVHMSLPTKNLDEAVKFYSALFGEGPVKRKVDYAKFDPKSVAFNLTFHVVGENREIDTSSHLGFQIDDQAKLGAIYQRLRSENLIAEEKKESICCYANQDKFWIQDPMGFRWELYRLLEDTEQKIDNRVSCCEGGVNGVTAKCG